LVHQCARKLSKSEKMGAKFVRTTTAILKRGEIKVLLQPFTTYIVDVHLYKNDLLPCYRVPQKTVKFVEEVVPKAHGSAIVCAHRNAIMQYNFFNVLGAFYRG